jgi:hypothetical protein
LRKYLLLPCVLLLFALGLAACGSGDGDESQIEDAIETSATSTDPSKCTEVETKAFVEQTSQETGAAAISECEKEAKEGEGAAESVEVSGIDVEGSKASAEAALTGGIFDGQTLEVELVEEGGQWKMNELTRFSKFDRTKLVKAFEAEIAESPQKTNKGFASCIIQDLEGSSQRQVEELMWGPEGFAKLGKKCF